MRSPSATSSSLRRAAIPFAALVIVATALGLGCSDDKKSDDDDDGGQGDAGGGQGGAGAGSTSSGTADGGGDGSGGSNPATGSGSGGAGAGGGSAADAVCARWNQDRADLGEGTWSGNVGACDPGDISADGRDNALRQVNLYRFLAGLPPVSTDPARDEGAQDCALLMHANGQLSHAPPTSWTCYSSEGSEGAGSSSISPTPGVTGVDLYMADPGNDTTLGHRRWILSEWLGPIGLGSTSEYSCMWVLGGSGNGDAPYIAWPPPGPFPAGALTASFASVDETGWSVQSSTIDLGGAQVTVNDGGQELPVAVNQLDQNYGSTWALRIVPQGWTSQVGHTYTVNITGVDQPISYAVEIVACD